MIGRILRRKQKENATIQFTIHVLFELNEITLYFIFQNGNLPFNKFEFMVSTAVTMQQHLHFMSPLYHLS